MRIQHNIMAMNAYRNYTNNVSAMKSNLEKLSSGYKINRAGDDAAGLAISEKMRAQITGLETAQKNAKDGISLVQTAEGALTEVHDMLNRMVELATQSANGTYDDTTDRAALQQELDQLKDEINRISKATNFNGIDLLSGNYASKSASAVGELLQDPKYMIDGSDPTAAGAAVVNFKLQDANAAAAKTVAASATTDGAKISAATPGKITIKMGGVENVSLKAGTIGSTPVSANATTIDLASWATGDELTFDIDGTDVTIDYATAGNAAALVGELAKYGVTLENTTGTQYSIAATDSEIDKAGVLVSDNDGTDTNAKITDGMDADDIGALYIKNSGNYYKISDYYDVSFSSGTTAGNGVDVILTAKTDGNLSDGTNTNEITAAIKGFDCNIDSTNCSALDSSKHGSVTLTEAGTDAGLASPAAAYTEYELNLDWDLIQGGTTLSFGTDDTSGINFVFTTNGANTTTTINGATYTQISISTSATAQEKATALKAALDAHTSFGNNGTSPNFDIELDTSGSSPVIKLTGKEASTGATASAAGVAKTNLGQLRSNITGALGTSTYKPVQYTSAPNGPTSPFASASYNIGELDAGAKIYIGDKCVEIVASTTAAADVKPGQVKMNAAAATLKADIIAAFEAQGVARGKIELTEPAAGDTDWTLKIIGTTVEEKGADLAKNTTVKVLSADDIPTASSVTLGGSSNVITAGTTKVSDIKAFQVGGADLGDNFTVLVNGSEQVDGYEIQEGDEITITANRKGKLSDTVMNALKPAGTGLATSSVSNGYDEGSTAAGDKTTYQLVFDMASLVGGNTFTIGNADSPIGSHTFEISIDSDSTKNGGNGTIGANEKDEVAGRTSIDIFNKDDTAAAAAIVNAIKAKMGSDFDMNSQLVNGKLTIDLTAAKEGQDYNLGNIRFSSNSAAITHTEYNPAGGAANGIEGTYAKVSWKFDKSMIQSGDTLTVGDTTIYFGDETKAENVDGKTKITVSAEDAKKDVKEIVKALESAGYRSGQVQFTEGDTVMSITGIATGQTAADLAKAGGKVSFGNVDGRPMTSGGLTLQIGDTADSYNQITVNIEATDCEALGIDGISVANQEGAQSAVDVIKAAINKVSTIRGTLGATQNRLDHTINNLSVMTENIQDAESTIRDVDVAEEMMAYTKNNILIQSAQAMLAQANQVPQGVLQLLQ